MAREFFEEWNPNADSLAIVQQANSIIEEYLAEGLTLTLRQLYYQFVSKDLIPNSDKSYDRLGMIISKARLAGMLDWDAIEDRVRVPTQWAEYASPREMLEEKLRSYRLKRHVDQDTYVELWVEKDALAGVLRPIAAEYHVTLMVNRGYSSSTAMKEAADRLTEKVEEYGCSFAEIHYLGDHDPSGEDMVRDIRDRLTLFLGHSVDFEVKKLALTMDQINKYKPPPNPAKLSDSRAKAYIAKYGRHSWEVDALPPKVLRSIIEKALRETLDMRKIEAIKEREEEHKQALEAALESLED